jgi:hypothetical protein
MRKRPEDGADWKRLTELQAEQGRSGETSSANDRRDFTSRPRPDFDDRPAPREDGVRLATFARPGKFGKPTEELRVVQNQIDGNAFLALTIWYQGTDGRFYPRKLISIRRNEIVEVIKALVAGAKALGIDPDAQLEMPRDGGDR